MRYFKRYRTRSVVLLVFIFFALFISGCTQKSPPKQGGKLEYNDSELFYTPDVTKEKAQKLGEYLLETGFFQGENPATVQLAKEGNVYQFRMVVRDDQGEDEEFLRAAGLFAAHISKNVFDNEIVETHICDRELNTLQVVDFQLVDSQDDQE
ncbi:MAG: hypothetical protein ISS27_00005 [Candidatus Omnitrophica bacterium]|nr:hypothetical protein [Candidatus Omnitrophota bacterium]